MSADLERFLASLDPDPREAWHDGLAYDIATLKRLPPSEREVAFAKVCARPGMTGADVEVFEEIGSAQAIVQLRRYAQMGEPAVRLAATHALGRLEHDPHAARRWLVSFLADPGLSYDELGGLLALLPGELKLADAPELRRALIACSERGGEAAPYAGALLLGLAGISRGGFAWGSFPFLSRLDAKDASARIQALAAFREILAQHGVVLDRLSPTPELRPPSSDMSRAAAVEAGPPATFRDRRALPLIGEIVLVLAFGLLGAMLAAFVLRGLGTQLVPIPLLGGAAILIGALYIIVRRRRARRASSRQPGDP